MSGVLAALTGCTGSGERTTDMNPDGPATTDDPGTSTGEPNVVTSSDSGTSTGTPDVVTSGETGSTDATATTGETDGRPVECACIPDDPAEGHWGEQPSAPTCGEALCPIVEAHGSKSWPDGDFVLENPEALECMLEALRDRTYGVVRWTWSRDGGQFSDTGYILIHEDGTAIRRRWGDQDLSYVMSDATYGRLPEVSALELCLTEGSPPDRFDCAVSFNLGPPTLICDEGWVDDNYA
jgi:hypothetical protein